MQIKDIITKDPELISPDTSIAEAAKKMSERDIGALFVRSGDRLVGVLTDRDIATRAVAKGLSAESTVKDIMTQKVLYCFEDDPIEAVAENLSRNQVRRLPVLDRNKRLLGVVSVGDLSRRGQKDAVSMALSGICQATKT